MSDLRERQLWRTPEWPPGSVRPWEACLWTTEQWLGALRGVRFLHGTIQHGLGLNVGASNFAAATATPCRDGSRSPGEQA